MLRIERALSILASLLIFLTTAGLVAFTIVLFAFVGAELAMSSEIATPAWAARILDTTLPVVGFDPGALAEDPATYRNVVSLFLSSGLRAVTVWFTLVPFVAYLQYCRAIKRAGVVDVHRVRKVGKTDLKTMLQYYRFGDDITVFSGDFDWILKNKKLRKLMVDKAKAGKIHLISYKLEDDIEQAWNETAQRFRVNDDDLKEARDALHPCFRFHQRKFKFSFIDLGSGHTAFLSLVPKASFAGHDCNIGVQSGKSHLASSLLHVVRNLFSREDYEKLRKWQSKERRGSTCSQNGAGRRNQTGEILACPDG
jgi:hypothetical protein